MVTIGIFTPAQDCFLASSIRKLDLDTPAQLEPANSNRVEAPAYCLHAREIELGAV